MTPFDAYRLYVAVKLHMTTEKYDMFKYCGKVRTVTPAAFELRNDKWSFVKLAKQFPREEELALFLACNHLKSAPYIRDLLALDEYQDNYKHHLKVRESLDYTVEQDMRYLLDLYPKPMDMIAVKNGQWPVLAQDELKYGNIEIETVCVLGTIMNFFPMWKSRVTDTILWPSFFLHLTKFTPFVRFDHDAMKTRLTTLISQHSQEKALTNAQ